MRKLLAWWSERNQSIALDMDPMTAVRLDAWLMGERASRIVPPEAMRFHEAIKQALRECPAEKR